MNYKKDVINTRIDPVVEEQLTAYSQKTGKSKSELIREMIEEKLAEDKKGKTPWELGKDLFGSFSSGSTDNALNRKAKLKQKLSDKSARRH